MTPFVVPSIFTASDRYSNVLRNMGARTNEFAGRLNNLNQRSQNLFSRLTPHLSETSRQLLDVASTAAIAGGIISTGKWSIDSLMKYEDELANLKSVTGSTDAEMKKFEGQINDVAKQTKKSSVEVAQAFTAIANNQPELLKDAAALAEVTKQSIILSKAAKIDLEPAGQAVTQILNQYGKGAADAAKTVDVLAAGSVAGSSEIRDTADAIKAFGTVAAVAGVKIDESVALIELGSKFDKGAEAGVKFRNILLNMTGAKVLDKLALKDLKKAGVNLDIVSDKSLPLNNRLLEMSKIAKDTNAIMHVFGKENAAMAAGVLTNASSFEKMLKDVGTVGLAEQMAATNTNTLSNKIDQLKASFINVLTSSENVSSGLTLAKDAAGWLAENMSTVLTVGVSLLGLFAAWKTTILVGRAALIAYNIVLGISAYRSASLVVGVRYTEVALKAQAIATRTVIAAQWLWNAAMNANPLGLLIAGMVAFTAAAYGVTKAIQAGNVAQSVQNQVKEKAADLAADQIADAHILFMALRKNTAGSEEYRNTLKKINDLSPDLVKNYNLEAGALNNINAAEKQLIGSIMKRAEQEARAELLKEKTKELVKSKLTGPSIMDYVLATASNQSAERYSATKNAITQGEVNQLSSDIFKNQETKPVASSKAAMSEVNSTITKNNNSNMKLIIENESNNPVKANGESSSLSVMPGMSSTAYSK